MSLTIRYEGTQTVLTSIGSNAIRFGGLALSQSAEIGEPLISENNWDDAAAEWVHRGYREFWVNETAAPTNDQVIYNGFILSRTITRGPSEKTTSARQIRVETADGNVALGWRILFNENANRPAETAGDRIRWLVNSSGVLPSLFAHPTYFATSSVAMDANDYRGQRYNDVLGDIASQTGYNFYVAYSEVRARSELIFMDPGGSDYASTLRISNLLSEVTGTHDTTGLVFAPSEDAELHVDPSRIAADVYVPYDGGSVFISRGTTASTFARVDQVAPTSNIKTAAKATALANRYLDDNDEEDERVTCSIVVPASQVNDLRQGMLTYARFTHFPGWESFRACRVLKRTVIQEDAIGQSAYRIDMELSPSTASGGGGGGAVIETVTLHACNDIISGHGERNAIVDSAMRTFTAGEVWRYTITNTAHDNSAITDSIKLDARTAGPILRAWGTAYGYAVGQGVANGTLSTGPGYEWPDQGFPPAVLTAQTGTVVIAGNATDVFRFNIKAGYYGAPLGPVTVDECWTAVLERIA